MIFGLILTGIFQNSVVDAQFTLENAVKEASGGKIKPEAIREHVKHLPIDSGTSSDAFDIVYFFRKVLIDPLLKFAAAIAVFMIIWNAQSLVLAAGNSETIGNAKKGLIWSAVGLGAIVFSYVVVKTVIFLSYSGAG